MDVLMPQLGETVAEGKITKWFKAVGEAVASGDNLCEIETDKVTVEVPAISSGVLTAINAEVGTVAPVGTIIAVVSNSVEKTAQVAVPATAPIAGLAPPKSTAAPSRPVSMPSTSFQAGSRPAPRREPLDPFREVDTPAKNFGPATLANGIVTTPLARRLAANGSIELGQLTGSGPRGRIIGRDVERAIAARGTAGPAGRISELTEPVSDLYRGRPHKFIPVDGMRRTIATRLTQSKSTIPHFYLAAHIETGRLARVRAEINESAPKDALDAPAYKLSLNDFMIKALALALQDVPAANAIWSSDGIFQFEHSDIAVAVAIPGGLFTPVVMSAETKSIATISNEVRSLAQRARDRALRPEEYQGGSTTISNLGMHGVEEFSAIINPPQATILAIGAVARHPIEAPEGIAFVDRIKATLSCDHRVVDGVTGAELLARFKSLIENPLRMLV
jgi:pyruvate dehydrogenase E2 component (dihydrolipoamide acetyltransferase)